jgi:hypothetical protein
VLLIAAAALAASTATDVSRDMQVIDPTPRGSYCPEALAGRTFMFDKPLVEPAPSGLPGRRTFIFDKPLVRSIPLSKLPGGRISVPLDRRVNSCSAVYPAGIQG